MSEAVKIIQHIIVAISSRSQGNNCISEATPSVCGCRDFDWIGWEVPRGWGNGWKRKKSHPFTVLFTPRLNALYL